MNHQSEIEASTRPAQPAVPEPSLRSSAAAFWLKYFFQNAALALRLLARGEIKRVFRSLHARIHNKVYWLIFPLVAPGVRRKAPLPAAGAVKLVTHHPVAFASPDHLAPYGTMYNNSTNRRFVLLLDRIVRRGGIQNAPAFLDLGCSGGQLVKDFSDLGWRAVGLEGSDYSLKHKRAHWREMAGKNLFTCDITKPFHLKLDQQDLKFDLLTAWEVVEHIHPNDLGQLFENIRSNLAEGGYFIASTASGPSIQDGIELHQTRMSNREWREYIAKRYSDLEWVDLGLQTHEYVRYDFGEPSFLVYRKVAAKSEPKPG